jgi:hypothetical protein
MKSKENFGVQSIKFYWVVFFVFIFWGGGAQAMQGAKTKMKFFKNQIKLHYEFNNHSNSTFKTIFSNEKNNFTSPFNNSSSSKNLNFHNYTTNKTNSTNNFLSNSEEKIEFNYSISYPITNLTIQTYDLEKEFIKFTKNRTVDKNTVYINKNFCNLKNLRNNKTHNLTKFSEIVSSNLTNEENNTLIEESFGFNFQNRKQKIKMKKNITHTAKISIIHSPSNNTIRNKNSTNSSSSEIPNYLLKVIADQSEAIKKEICFHCLEILEALDFLVGEIKIIKNKHKKLIESKNLNSKEKSLKVANLINNINYVKADLYKLNEILKTLQKADCPNFLNNSKKYRMVVNYTNKLVEIIQQSLKSLNLKLNLVILS